MKAIRWFAIPLLVPAAVATLVLGAKPDRIRAAHPTHSKNDVACETCHGAATSQSGADNLLPTMETCASCHDIENTENCKQCHTSPEAPAASPRVTAVTQKFPHEKHVAVGMECAKCHGETGKTEPQLPAKSLCRTCHETASAQSDCAVCHAESEPRRPVTHTNQWLAFHATDAQVNEARCADCHTQKDCQDCHSGDNVRPRVHRLNFAFDHAVDARGKETNCASCHESAQFCQSCHQAERVMPRDHSRSDWVLRKTGGKHAEEGRFDLETCVSCHDAGNQAPICADCHGR
jgi:hypothetical protein